MLIAYRRMLSLIFPVTGIIDPVGLGWGPHHEEGCQNPEKHNQ